MEYPDSWRMEIIKLNEMIWIEGTTEEIAAELEKKANIPKLPQEKGYQYFAALFVEFLTENQEQLLSDEEEFQINLPRRNAGEQGLITPDAKYFIGLKKTTYLLFGAVLKGMASLKGINPIASNAFFDMLKEGLPKVEMAFLGKLDQALGESCIVLEAARHKKQGINSRNFPPENGECINNQLNCRMRENGRCRCSRTQAEKILEDLGKKKILEKEKESYFYTDFI